MILQVSSPCSVTITNSTGAVCHSDDLSPLLAVHEAHVEFLDTVCVFEGGNGIRKIHAVLAKVLGGFARGIVPDTGSRCK